MKTDPVNLSLDLFLYKLMHPRVFLINSLNRTGSKKSLYLVITKAIHWRIMLHWLGGTEGIIKT